MRHEAVGEMCHPSPGLECGECSIGSQEIDTVIPAQPTTRPAPQASCVTRLSAPRYQNFQTPALRGRTNPQGF